MFLTKLLLFLVVVLVGKRIGRCGILPASSLIVLSRFAFWHGFLARLLSTTFFTSRASVTIEMTPNAPAVKGLSPFKAVCVECNDNCRRSSFSGTRPCWKDSTSPYCRSRCLLCCFANYHFLCFVLNPYSSLMRRANLTCSHIAVVPLLIQPLHIQFAPAQHPFSLKNTASDIPLHSKIRPLIN